MKSRGTSKFILINAFLVFVFLLALYFDKQIIALMFLYFLYGNPIVVFY